MKINKQNQAFTRRKGRCHGRRAGAPAESLRFRGVHSWGFTLIEALIALTIFSIGILAILQIVPLATRVAMRSRLRTQAIFLSQAKEEEYLAKTYLELDPGEVESRAPIVTDTSSQLNRFETEVSITYIDETFNEVSEDTGMKKITVTTYWFEGSHERQERLVTFVSRY